MLCQVCKKAQAKVHYTQMGDDNQVKKIDLCQACAKEKGITDPATYGLADLVLGVTPTPKADAPAEPVETGPVCSRCGYTQAEFKKTGRLGCAECYDTFAEGLEALLKGMHKGVDHKGKAPPAVRRVHDLQARLSRLEADLRAAVDRENFERAAALRDEIKQARAALVAK